MLIFKITDPELNVLMARLFRENIFDVFEVRGLEIATFTNFQVSGALDRVFDDLPEAGTAHCSWERVKPFAVSFIKGKKRPKSIKITLAHPSELTAQVHPNAAALFLNISYEHNEAQLSTAVSQKNFSLDKSVDGSWDDYIDAFFKNNNIPVSTRL